MGGDYLCDATQSDAWGSQAHDCGMVNSSNWDVFDRDICSGDGSSGRIFDLVCVVVIYAVHGGDRASARAHRTAVIHGQKNHGMDCDGGVCVVYKFESDLHFGVIKGKKGRGKEGKR